MRRTNKKGFTIVELVIVIAVIAILAAVLIPTFSSLVQKANESTDTQLVRNLNTALTSDAKKHNTMSEALAAAEKFGYDVAKINASATGNEILWDSVNDLFCYLNDGEIEYIPESLKGDKPADYKYWKICTEMPATQTYSIYWNGEDAQTIDNLTVGFDAGTSSGVNITYVGDSAVTIYTNGGNLTVNNENAEVKHYGTALNVTIEAVAEDTYHEFGQVQGKLEIQKGHVVIEADATVGQISVANGAKLDVKDTEKVGVITGEGEVTGATTTTPKAVGSWDELQNAVADENVSYIMLTADITTSTNLNITRNLIIDGGTEKYSLTATQTSNNARAINIGYDGTRTYDDITVTLRRIHVAGPTSGSGTRGINIAGNNNTVNIFDATVTCSYYAINIVTADTSGLHLKVDNSNISGWGALNIWSNAHVIEVTNSTLTGNNDKNYDAGHQNDFGVIVFEADSTGKTNEFGYYNNVKVVNCTVNVQSKNNNEQQLVAFNPGTTGSLSCKAEFVGCTINYENEYCVPFYDGGSGNSLIIDGKVEHQS